MFFSGKTWFLIFLLLIILALGIRRHLRIQSVTERFETNSSLLEDVDLDAINERSTVEMKITYFTGRFEIVVPAATKVLY